MFVLRRGCPCCGCSFDAISEKTKQGKVFFYQTLWYLMSLSLCKSSGNSPISTAFHCPSPSTEDSCFAVKKKIYLVTLYNYRLPGVIINTINVFDCKNRNLTCLWVKNHP